MLDMPLTQGFFTYKLFDMEYYLAVELILRNHVTKYVTEEEHFEMCNTIQTVVLLRILTTSLYECVCFVFASASFICTLFFTQSL